MFAKYPKIKSITGILLLIKPLPHSSVNRARQMCVHAFEAAGNLRQTFVQADRLRRQMARLLFASPHSKA